MGVTLTFYGGVGEVGGNKILLEDGDTRIFLDFGRSFSLSRCYFSPPYLSPRSERELIELGILPRVEGLYEFEDSEKAVDAVFISHSHMDHSAHISFIKRSIPIYCGETTKIVLKALQTIRRTTKEFNFEGFTFHTFRTGNKIRVGSLEVEPIHVDHSVPGAYAFLVHTSAGTIAYTGDFRMHGSKPELTRDFLEKAADSDLIALISEGTNLFRAEVSTEQELMQKLRRVVEKTPGDVLADFSKSDIDRLKSFYNVAKSSDRKLIITSKQAFLLHKLTEEDKRLKIPSLNDESIYVYQKSKKRLFGWEKEIRDIVGLNKMIDGNDLEKGKLKAILVLSLYDFEELVKIKPKAGSCYILSSSEPINEEMELDFDKLINWLSHYGIPQYHIHVSGHIMPLQLREIIENLNPNILFPIHCERPEIFRNFVSDLNCKTVIPVKNEKYKV